MKAKYHISGMTCSACSSHVEKAVGKLTGVEKASVNLLTETMEIEYDDNRLSPDKIVEAVEKAGYGATSLDMGKTKTKTAVAQGELSIQTNHEKHKQVSKDAETDHMKRRLLISLLFLVPLMYLAMYTMYHQLLHIPVPGFMNRHFSGTENALNYAITQFLLVLPILYVNRKFFQVGFRTLRHLSPNMDSLIALGATASVGYGIFAIYRIGYGLGHGHPEPVELYSHDLYFESAGMILTLITLGKFLESKSRSKTKEALSRLMDLSPQTAVVLDEQGNEKIIPTESVQKGDIFLVKPGSLVPVDGTVLEGHSGVNEAAITGESIPVDKTKGDQVICATQNISGFLKCRADRVGEDTTLSQIIKLVEEASSSKAPIASLADKVAGIFVPVVIGIALCTLVGWLIAGATPEFAISCSIAVLVISCPCALGLATPVSIMVGTGVGASKGILIKSGEALQTAQEIDTVVLDKTGTITEGTLKVAKITRFSDTVSEDQLLAITAALEKQSEHPLAKAIVSKAANRRLELPQVSDFQAVFGRGIRARTGEIAVFVGNESFLREQGFTITEKMLLSQEQMADEGMTPLWIGFAGEKESSMETAEAPEGKAGERVVPGLIGVADEIKKTAKEAVATLEGMGISVIMLTGDHARTAEAVRKQVGIREVIAQVLPREKEQHIRLLQKEARKVAMVGDGINDAPALMAADVGIAIGAGTDVAIESADIVLMGDDLLGITTAISLSRAVIRNIRQNLFWAFFYNSIGIPLAAGLLYPAFGLKLSPMFGAAAMSLSSVFVISNALRLRYFRGPHGKKGHHDRMDGICVPSDGLQKTGGVNSTENMEETERKDNSMKKEIIIDGMMCNHCTGRIQKALEALEQVEAVAVSLEEKKASITLKEAVSHDLLKEVIQKEGYEVVEIREA